MTRRVDSGQNLFALANVAFPINGSDRLPVAGAPSFAAGNLFDVSAWESWALYGQASSVGAWPLRLQLIYPNTLLGDPLAQTDAIQTIVLPGSNGAGVAPFCVVGRFLGPLVYVQWVSGNPGAWQGRLQLIASNRPRRFDGPYTPADPGTPLWTQQQFDFVAPVTNISASLPYYIGPAYFHASLDVLGASPGSVQVGIFDQVTANYIAQLRGGVSEQTQLWLPQPPVANGSAWQVRIRNTDGAVTHRIAGALVTA